MTFPLQKNLLGLPLAPAQCVVDPALQIETNKIINDCARYINDDLIVPNFLKDYTEWIKHSQLNNIDGIDSFIQADFCHGTSEAFDHFYMRHSKKRFRCFRGEYLYHQLVWNHSCPEWKYLDDEPLVTNDVVVCSLPFADTGNIHLNFNKNFLDLCQSLDIPVLVDMAFFGICGQVNFDLSHPAITDVCFSLSKTFPVSLSRIGMRLCKKNLDDGLQIYNRTQYVNRMSAGLGSRLLRIISADDTFLRYRNKQLSWCKLHDLEPSDTVIFGLDTNHRHNQYNRGSAHTNRICFSTCYQFEAWPESIKID